MRSRRRPAPLHPLRSLCAPHAQCRRQSPSPRNTPFHFHLPPTRAPNHTHPSISRPLLSGPFLHMLIWTSPRMEPLLVVGARAVVAAFLLCAGGLAVWQGVLTAVLSDDIGGLVAVAASSVWWWWWRRCFLLFLLLILLAVVVLLLSVWVWRKEYKIKRCVAWSSWRGLCFWWSRR